jgi:hypothetical protein
MQCKYPYTSMYIYVYRRGNLCLTRLDFTFLYLILYSILVYYSTTVSDYNHQSQTPSRPLYLISCPLSPMSMSMSMSMLCYTHFTIQNKPRTRIQRPKVPIPGPACCICIYSTVQYVTSHPPVRIGILNGRGFWGSGGVVLMLASIEIWVGIVCLFLLWGFAWLRLAGAGLDRGSGFGFGIRGVLWVYLL